MFHARTLQKANNQNNLHYHESYRPAPRRHVLKCKSVSYNKYGYYKYKSLFFSLISFFLNIRKQRCDLLVFC